MGKTITQSNLAGVVRSVHSLSLTTQQTRDHESVDLAPKYIFHDHIMGGARGMAGGSCPPLCHASPAAPPPVVVRKNYTCPLDPSRPNVTAFFFVKTTKCVKTLHSKSVAAEAVCE